MSIFQFRKSLFFLCACGLALAAAGCTGSHLKTGSGGIVGTWKASDHAELIFAANGSLAIKHFPASAIDFGARGKISGSATWKFISSTEGKYVLVGAKRLVPSKYDPLVCRGYLLSGSPLRMYFWLDNPQFNRRLTLTKSAVDK